jgi:hypothetical protein
VDIVILTDTPADYTANERWPVALGLSAVSQTRTWGAITEQRVSVGNLEVEFGIGTPAWASTNPVDPGTERVTRNGLSILYDPRSLLANLLSAIAVADVFDVWRRRREAEGADVTLIDLYDLIAKQTGVAAHELRLEQRAALRQLALPIMWPGYREAPGSERAELDPIEIVPYDPAWPMRFLNWRRRIEDVLGSTAERIEYVGSTAIPRLPAKPVVDIQLSVADLESEEQYAPMIEGLGIQLRSRDPASLLPALFWPAT